MPHHIIHARSWFVGWSVTNKKTVTVTFPHALTILYSNVKLFTLVYIDQMLSTLFRMAYFVEEHYPYHKRVLLLLGPHFVWLRAQLYLVNCTMDMMDENENDWRLGFCTFPRHCHSASKTWEWYFPGFLDRQPKSDLNLQHLFAGRIGAIFQEKFLLQVRIFRANIRRQQRRNNPAPPCPAVPFA